MNKVAFYDRTNNNLAPPDHTTGDFDLTGNKFSVNGSNCIGCKNVIVQNWQGKLISGRSYKPLFTIKKDSAWT